MILPALLVAASVTAADPFVGDATIGVGPGVGPGFVVPTGETAVTFAFLPHRLKIAVQLRGQAIFRTSAGPPVGFAGTMGAGIHFNAGAGVFLRALAGFAFSGACLRGDFCGGLGPDVSAEIGVKVPAGAPVHFVALARLNASFLWANSVDYFITPSLNVGIGW